MFRAQRELIIELHPSANQAKGKKRELAAADESSIGLRVFELRAGPGNSN